MIDPRLVEVLACPLDDERPPLELRGDKLYCAKCNVYFPIVNGIPHLLPENAIPADQVKDNE